jgi:hypothetical protein
MRTGRDGCHFFKNGRCSIYEFRPLDCRLFPFDVVHNPEDGSLLCVAYVDFCPAGFRPEDYTRAATKVLSEMGTRLPEYALSSAPRLKNAPRVTLGRVEIDERGRVSLVPKLNGSGAATTTLGSCLTLNSSDVTR